MRHTLRVWNRGARLILLLTVGLAAVVAVRLDFTHRLDAQRIAQWWSRRLLRILNLRLDVHGAPIDGPRVTVANHVSWLDISVIAACEPTHFIAKSEIRSWPVAGWFANAAGTFYIRRGKGGARPMIDRLVPHLNTGGSVVLFPEGTTTDGREVRSFHARLFCAAVEAGVPVQPVALSYAPASGGHDIAPFIGDDDLVSHILRLLREPELGARIVYCAPLPVQDQDRNSLARQAEDAVRKALLPPQAPPASSAPQTLTALTA